PHLRCGTRMDPSRTSSAARGLDPDALLPAFQQRSIEVDLEGVRRYTSPQEQQEIRGASARRDVRCGRIGQLESIRKRREAQRAVVIGGLEPERLAVATEPFRAPAEVVVTGRRAEDEEHLVDAVDGERRVDRRSLSGDVLEVPAMDGELLG